MKRRSLILGGVAGALGLGALLRPRDAGHDHSPYFRALSAALDNAGQSKPTLVIDRERLLANIQTLKSHISDRFAYRIVVKSLPSVPLLETVMQVTGSTSPDAVPPAVYQPGGDAVPAGGYPVGQTDASDGRP